MIRKLNKKIIDQIAAGEIIHRPSFVLKELLENAIDAKSKNINVKIKNAGKKLIQIMDDGIGMNEKDSSFCFTKHATSKINKYEDLWKIKTFSSACFLSKYYGYEQNIQRQLSTDLKY